MTPTSPSETVRTTHEPSPIRVETNPRPDSSHHRLLHPARRVSGPRPLQLEATLTNDPLNSAVGISIGQTIFLHSLIAEVPKSVRGISPQAVFHDGATNLPLLAPDPDVLRALRGAYARAVVDVLYFALGTAAVALPFALVMEWRNVKTTSERRVEDAKGEEACKTEGVALRS